MESWKVANSGGAVIKDGVGHPETICTLETVPLSITPEVEARAKLIAAAPDLLRACQGMKSCLDSLTITDFAIGGDRSCRITVEAAIIRATT